MRFVRMNYAKVSSTTWDFENVVIVRIVDGDSFVGNIVQHIILDIGFGDTHETTITRQRAFRLAGINARELANPGGKEARDNLKVLLPPGSTVRLWSVKNDKFGGRFDAQVWLGGVNVCQLLVDQEWAAVWDGVGKAPVPPWPRTIG